MAKSIQLVIVFFGITLISFAQIPVDTLPHNKNVLLEEYTGVKCSACPSGHIAIDNAINAHPSRVFAAGMHSESVGHVTPYGSDENLARPFPDLLRPKIPDLYSIPSGIISRRKALSGKENYLFIYYAPYGTAIDSAINFIKNEPSPFNIGIVANYDTVNKILSVSSQVYTTASTPSTYKLNVYFTQSNIFVSQLSGATVIPNYNQKHVFREILTPTWGASLFPSGANKGDIVNSFYTFSNTTRNYKMQDVEVLVFITDHSVTTNSKGQIVQVMGVHVNMTGSTTGINESSNNEAISIYPNPNKNQIHVHLSNPILNNELYIHDISGKLILKKEIGTENNNTINHQLAPGVYFLTVKNNPDLIKKLIVQ